MMWDNRITWTYAQVSLLWELARDGAPMQEISFRVGRTPEDIRVKASELGIALTHEGYSHVSINPASYEMK